MPLPNPISVGDVPHQILSSAAIATTLYMPVIRPGRVKDFFITTAAAVATANQTFTLAYAEPGSSTFTNVTNGVIVHPTSGAAAGRTIRQQVTPGDTTYVADGGTFRISSAGGGSAGVPLIACVVVGS